MAGTASLDHGDPALLVIYREIGAGLVERGKIGSSHRLGVVRLAFYPVANIAAEAGISPLPILELWSASTGLGYRHRFSIQYGCQPARVGTLWEQKQFLTALKAPKLPKNAR
jgi:hypothetical protein